MPPARAGAERGQRRNAAQRTAAWWTFSTARWTPAWIHTACVLVPTEVKNSQP